MAREAEPVGAGPTTAGQRPPVLHDLQRRAGNRATNDVLALAQTKLEVGRAADPREREADAVASRVAQSLSCSPSAEGAVRAAHGPRPARAGIQRRAASGSGSGSGAVDSDTESQLREAQSQGRPLAAPVKTAMESALGADFSDVRVHAGQRADDLNERLGAKAFTLGSDVFFKGRVPDASSPASAELMAHELTHVVQQRAEGTADTVRRLIDDKAKQRAEDLLDDIRYKVQVAWSGTSGEELAQKLSPEVGRIEKLGVTLKSDPDYATAPAFKKLAAFLKVLLREMGTDKRLDVKQRLRLGGPLEDTLDKLNDASLESVMEGFDEVVAMETFRGREKDDKSRDPSAGHALDRHGSDKSKERIKERITKGNDPGDPTQKAYTKTSSQWKDMRTALEAREKAEELLMKKLNIKSLKESGGATSAVILINHGKSIVGAAFQTPGGAGDVDSTTTVGTGKQKKTFKTWKEASLSEVKDVKTSRTLLMFGLKPGAKAGATPEWYQMQHFPDDEAKTVVPTDKQVDITVK